MNTTLNAPVQVKASEVTASIVHFFSYHNIQLKRINLKLDGSQVLECSGNFVHSIEPFIYRRLLEKEFSKRFRRDKRFMHTKLVLSQDGFKIISYE